MALSEDQLSLIVKLKTEGMAAGADEVRGLHESIGDMDQGLKKATESTHTLQGEQLGSIRTASHLFRGLVEIGEGGPLAIAGVSAEVRILGEVFESLLGPLGAPLIILTSLASIGIPILERAFGGLREAGKKSADDVREAWALANDELKSKLEEISKTKFWDQQLAAAKLLTTEIHDQASALDAVEKAQEKLVKTTQDMAVARLDLKEQQALEGKEGPEAERIKNDFAAQRDELRAKDETERKNMEIKRLNDEKAAIQAEAAAKLAESNAAVADAQVAAAKAHQAVLDFARQQSDNAGFGDTDYTAALKRRDALADQEARAGTEDQQTGETIKPLTAVQQIDLDNLRKGGLEDLRKKQEAAGDRGIYDEQYEKAKQEREEIEKGTEAISQGGTIKGMDEEQTKAQIDVWTTRAKALADYMAQIDTYRNLLKQEDEADAARTKAYIADQAAKKKADADLKLKDIEIDTAHVERDTIPITAATKTQEITNQDIEEARKATEAVAAAQKKIAEVQAEIAKFKESKEATDLNGQIETIKSDLKAATAKQGNAKPESPEAEQAGAQIAGLNQQIAAIHSSDTAQRAAQLDADLKKANDDLTKAQAAQKAITPPAPPTAAPQPPQPAAPPAAPPAPPPLTSAEQGELQAARLTVAMLKDAYQTGSAEIDAKVNAALAQIEALTHPKAQVVAAAPTPAPAAVPVEAPATPPAQPPAATPVAPPIAPTVTAPPAPDLTPTIEAAEHQLRAYTGPGFADIQARLQAVLSQHLTNNQQLLNLLETIIQKIADLNKQQQQTASAQSSSLNSYV